MIRIRTTATTTPEITAVVSTDEPEEGGEEEGEEETEGEEREGEGGEGERGGDEREGGKTGGEGREVVEKEERVVDIVKEREEERDPRGVLPIVEKKEEGNGVTGG